MNRNSNLGALAKLRKATISYVMSVCMAHLGSPWTDFHEIWYLCFSKICRENSSFIKIWQEQLVLYTKT